MDIIENKALAIRTRSPDKYRILPKHKVLPHPEGGYTVLVHWGLDEARVLRNLGVKNVPSPIVGRYNWPGRYKPMAHQRETASFLTLHRRAFVLSEPGTGKTMSALWAADYLMQRRLVRRMLILCPLSIMQTAWLQDIANSIIHRSAAIAHHPKATRRIEIIQGNYDIIVCNYDGLNLVANEVKADGRFDLVIVDEATAYKNVQTQRWKVLNSIIGQDTYLWMMTGTPAAQSPADAYGLAKLVNPSNVPKFWTGWRDSVMNKVTAFKWVPKADAKAKVFEALQPAVRFTKAQCMDLPPVVTTTRVVPMTPQQNKYYLKLKNDLLMNAAGATVTAANAAVAVNKLLQISCGVVYTDNQEIVEFDALPRLKVLEEVIEQTERKVIVFALFRAAIESIAMYLQVSGYTCEVIHGDVTAIKRADIISRFQTQPNPHVLVMQPQAAAHGITLTAADNVVFFGPLMSVEQYVQAVARADRKGQDSDRVTVTHISGSPIEERMFKLLQGRVESSSALADMFESELKEGLPQARKSV